MKKNCFQRSSRLFSILLFLFAFCAIGHSFSNDQKDREEFEQLRAAQPEKLSMKQFGEKPIATQEKIGIFKKIIIPCGTEDRFFQIEADRSTLEVIARNKKKRLVETFHNAHGIIQESLFFIYPDGEVFYANDDGEYLSKKGLKPSMASIDPEQLVQRQRFRYFEAKKAVHDFEIGTLRAENVTFWIYETDNHDLLLPPYRLEPIMKGRARSMLFPLSMKKDGVRGKFTAEDFSMTLLPGDRP